MYYGNVKYSDIANGEGVRTSLFVSGCTHHCKECFQPETWNFSYGQEFTQDVADAIVESLKAPWVEGLTVLGGEPMEPVNQQGLLPLLRRVRAEVPGKNVWCYTGDHFEALCDPQSPRHTDATDELLSLIDVLVDGPSNASSTTSPCVSAGRQTSGLSMCPPLYKQAKSSCGRATRSSHATACSLRNAGAAAVRSAAAPA